jgi:tRNA1(Val) A37 N6-methylase TrmN6
METSTDRVLGNRLQLMQPAEGYRAAIDPVLLAAAIDAKAGERILDLGCGVGTAGLCLLARVSGIYLTGLDLQPGLIALATRNAAANGLSGSAFFQCGDLLAFRDGGFDHVLANPPYLAREKASISPNPIKAMANVEGDARLADWVGCAIAAVKFGGRVTFIHRADREGELRTAMSQGLGDLQLVRFLPRLGAEAKRVIMSGRKGADPGFRQYAPWVLHAANGSFTPETEAILRDAAPLNPIHMV